MHGNDIQVGLLTGGGDKHYAVGLATALSSKGVRLDVIGSDEVDSPELHGIPNVTFLNLRGDTGREAGLVKKVSRVLVYYIRLVLYAARGTPRVLHILWNNKFEFFDRTLLMLYYKACGKKVVLTAHNVNAGARDSTDSSLNRVTLRIQYRLADHIFVHTEPMKREILEGFGVRNAAVSVIPYGINNAIPNTDLTPEHAKSRMGIRCGTKTMLFFGNIAPYKGLDYLVAAFEHLIKQGGDYRLIIAGRVKRGCEEHWANLEASIRQSVRDGFVIPIIDYIPDDDVELYFKASDVLILPYTQIFQSGVLFMAGSFGLPVIASDVGSLKEDVIHGKTGFVCKPRNAVDLEKTIETYFSSDLYRALNSRRQDICNYFNERHSWGVVGQITRNVYADLVGH